MFFWFFVFLGFHPVGVKREAITSGNMCFFLQGAKANARAGVCVAT